MTTTSTQSHIAEHKAANARGIQLQGEADWRNFSRYADRPSPPGRDTHVRLGLDSGGFVRELHVLDLAAATTPLSSRDREIRRLACAKVAATFCSGKVIAGVDVSTEDLLKVASRIEKWVLAEPEAAPAL